MFFRLFFSDPSMGTSPSGLGSSFNPSTVDVFVSNSPSPTGSSTVTGALPFLKTGGSSHDPPPPIVLPNGQISVHSFTSKINSFTETRPPSQMDSIVIPTRASPRSRAPDITPRQRKPEIQSVVTTNIPVVSRPTPSTPVRRNTFTLDSEVSVSVEGSPRDALSRLINSLTSPSASVAPVAPTSVARVEPHSKIHREPDVQIIEIPILPEGQTAALLNITRDVRASLVETESTSVGKAIPQRQTTLSRDGNVLRLRVGECGMCSTSVDSVIRYRSWL